MADPITDVELYLVDLLKAGFAGTVRMVDSLPDDWDDKTFERLLRDAPGAYVVFGGGQASPQQTDDEASLEGGWSVVLVTTHKSGEKARRHGDLLQIGAYAMINTTVALLHGHTIPDVGTLVLSHVDNLNGDAVDRQGGAIYAAGFRLRMTFDAGGVEPSTLDNFLTYTDDVHMADSENAVDASDIVHLEPAP